MQPRFDRDSWSDASRWARMDVLDYFVRTFLRPRSADPMGATPRMPSAAEREKYFTHCLRSTSAVACCARSKKRGSTFGVPAPFSLQASRKGFGKSRFSY
jgi:hypothetical protein